MEVPSHCKNLSLLWVPSFPTFGAGIFEVEEAVRKHVIEGVLSWIVENVEKTRTSKCWRQWKWWFLARTKKYSEIRFRNSAYSYYIHSENTHHLWIWTIISHPNLPNRQITSSDVGSWLSLFSVKEGLQHTRRTMVVEQRCSQTLGQAAAKKHCKALSWRNSWKMALYWQIDRNKSNCLGTSQEQEKKHEKESASLLKQILAAAERPISAKGSQRCSSFKRTRLRLNKTHQETSSKVIYYALRRNCPLGQYQSLFFVVQIKCKRLPAGGDPHTPHNDVARSTHIILNLWTRSLHHAFPCYLYWSTQ